MSSTTARTRLPLPRHHQVPGHTANVKPNAQSKLGDRIKPSLVLEIGGQKIGIVGGLTNDVVDISSPGPNVAIEDDVKAMTAEVEKLKAAGVNKIIALPISAIPANGT